MHTKPFYWTFALVYTYKIQFGLEHISFPSDFTVDTNKWPRHDVAQTSWVNMLDIVVHKLARLLAFFLYTI